jgi:hypothetical protein
MGSDVGMVVGGGGSVWVGGGFVATKVGSACGADWQLITNTASNKKYGRYRILIFVVSLPTFFRNPFQCLSKLASWFFSYMSI